MYRFIYFVTCEKYKYVMLIYTDFNQNLPTCLIECKDMSIFLAVQKKKQKKTRTDAMVQNIFLNKKITHINICMQLPSSRDEISSDTHDESVYTHRFSSYLHPLAVNIVMFEFEAC